MLDLPSFSALARAGDERIELPPKVLETPIIPFDQSPIFYKNDVLDTSLFIIHNFIVKCNSFLYLQNFIQIIRLSQFIHNNILALLVCPLSYQFEKYQLDSASLHLATICFANPVQKVLALVQASLPHAVHFCPLLFFSFSID